MSNQLRFLLFFILLIRTFSAFGQEKKGSHLLIENLNNRKGRLPQEKVHLHLDRSFYISGDTIRFASYVVNSVNNIPSDLSHVLHVELIGVDQRIIKLMPIRLVAGFGSGDFALADSIPDGIYLIRAYTNWMRNFDAKYFFYKEINIFNPFTKQIKTDIDAVPEGIKKEVTGSHHKYHVSFYPEGGQLVFGLSSRMGFKVSGMSGKGDMAKGALFDESGKRILEFNTGHDGLGSFYLTPVRDNIYTAVLKFPDNSTQSFKLPKVKQSGYVLSADNSNADSLYVKLQVSTDLINKEKMTFIPVSNGSPLFYMETSFPDQQINLTIPKSKIPGGVIQLSLLNAQNQPVSERLVFNRYTEEIKLDIKGLKPTYEKGEPVELELQATDPSGKPVIGSFSIAIVSGNSQSVQDSESGIYSDFLLSSDLGRLGQLNYYFNKISGENEKALDNLMLSQGWSRYTWKTIESNQIEPTPFEAEQKIKISGRIKGVSKNAIIANIPITLLVGELDSGMLLDTLTNDQGGFTFFLPDSMGYLPIRIQAKPKKNAKYEISQNEYQSPELSLYIETKKLAEAIKVSNQNQVYVDQFKASRDRDFTFSGNNKLKEVTIRDYNPKPRLTNSHSANLNGPGKADVVITSETLAKMPDLTSLDVLLPGVRRVGISGYRLNSSVGISHIPNVLVLIDGVDGIFKDLREVSIGDVESVEFLKDPIYTGIYGIRGAGGVILITSKKGNDKTLTNENVNGGLAKWEPIFSFKKENYNSGFVDESHLNRSQTIFWEAEILTDKTGKAKCRFVPSGQLKNFEFVIEGVGLNGSMINFSKQF